MPKRNPKPTTNWTGVPSKCDKCKAEYICYNGAQVGWWIIDGFGAVCSSCAKKGVTVDLEPTHA